MGFKFAVLQQALQRRGTLAGVKGAEFARFEAGTCRRGFFFVRNQAKGRLAAADKLQIDFSQDFRIEKSAVLIRLELSMP